MLFRSTFIVSVLVNLFLITVRKNGGTLLILCLTYVGVFAPVFQSHAASAGNHGLATGSLIFHVCFISIWVGGVIGLIIIAPAERALSISRFSAIALWAAIGVVISGSINAIVRLNSWSALKSFYANLVIDKIFLTSILIFAGYKHRQYLAAKIGDSRKVYKLLLGEALLMEIGRAHV